jgi:hypothetical protein
MVWKQANRTQLVPIAWGYTLYSAQDTYGLLDGFGDVVWENEIEGARRPRWTCIENSYFIEGDNHLILKVNIEDGKRTWKGSRLGGQLLLLADQDLLLIISEKGELVLVDTNPEQYSELARFSAIKEKTWNHPVLANDVLLVRNTKEMAAFKLPEAVN